MNSYAKINNSYESDTNSSSNSSSDSKVNQFPRDVELPKNLWSSKNKMPRNNKGKPGRRSMPTKSEIIVQQCSVTLVPIRILSLPSVADVDRLSENDGVGSLKKAWMPSVANDEPIPNSPSVERPSRPQHKIELKNNPVVALEGLAYDTSPVRTFGSEEISDQDITCRKEMEKFATNLNEIKNNLDLDNVSDFSIEPSSEQSDDVVAECAKPIRKEIIISSMSDNSCNAVDNNIAANETGSNKCDMGDLSFNGKIVGGFQNSQENVNLVDNVVEIQTESMLIVKPKVDLEMFRMNASREEINERSPDIFLDDDDGDDNLQNDYSSVLDNDVMLQNSSLNDEKESAIPLDKVEKTLAKKLQNQLASGIIPPPSVTFIEYDMTTLLNLYNENKREYALDLDRSINSDHMYSAKESTMTSDEEVKDMEFELAITKRNMGIMYNRTQYTDNIEIMYMKLAQRYVGRETDSSFVRKVCNHERNAIKKSLAQSPGNRLSHLARRRAVFSSANLLSNMPLGLSSKLGRKPCIIDASKLMKKDRPRTPKRRTPGRRKLVGRSTPTSSKKKFGSASKVSMHILPKPVTATRETSKRALFQSPAQEKPKVNFTPDVAVRVEKSKRALLFSPPKPLAQSPGPSSSILNRTASDVCVNYKRRRDDDENFSPRASKIAKSQSMCGGTLLHGQHKSSSLLKSISESSMNASQQLSGSHKQKLLWAVSTALKKKSITSSHESFKNYASTLAKVVKRFYMETLNDSEKNGGTSATMLRLADKLVFWVIQNKSVDEIYMTEKARQENVKNVTKLTGYIAADEYAKRRSVLNRSQSYDPSENTCPSTEIRLQLSELESKGGNGSTANSSSNQMNSSSKNNLSSNVLRENHDSKSAQKNAGFSGRDQKNVSPYSDKTRPTSNRTTKLLIGGASNSNVLKVRRQISFDA